MFTCLICRFSVVLDDTLMFTAKGPCVCLRCYLIQVEDMKPLPKDLRRELVSVCEHA